MKIENTELPGCFELQPVVHRDPRGSFVKTFHAPSFEAAGLSTDFVEEYHSASRRGVIRGLHLQLPPCAHAKLVSCVHGEVFDVAVDLRVGSPTQGQAMTRRLTAADGNALYFPPGLAHGFQALTEDAIVVYRVTSVHAPAQDAGIRWDSAGIECPEPGAKVSERDATLPTLADFESPFRHQS